MDKKYYYLKKNDIIKDGDEVNIYGEYEKCVYTIGDCAGDYHGVPFRREIKQKAQTTKTKISRLKMALLNGKSFTPVSAGKVFGMQHNTFNKFIWVLKHEHGMDIKSDWVKGKTYKRHWVGK